MTLSKVFWPRWQLLLVWLPLGNAWHASGCVMNLKVYIFPPLPLSPLPTPAAHPVSLLEINSTGVWSDFQHIPASSSESFLVESNPPPWAASSLPRSSRAWSHQLGHLSLPSLPDGSASHTQHMDFGLNPSSATFKLCNAE